MTIDQLTLTPSPGDATSEPEEWRDAGDAWSHAATDWAYRFEPHTRDAIEAILSSVGVERGASLLDVACGSGYLLGIGERRGLSVAGIDVASGLIDIATRRAPTAELVVGTMFDLPWDDDSFDVVTSINGIWGGCDDALAEAYRVLRPGGSIGVTFWGPGRALHLRDYFIVVGSTAPGVDEELKGLAAIGAPGVCEAMLENAGFEVAERGATSAVLEFSDDDDAWRVLRSPGVVLPSLDHVGESELRRQVLESIAPCRQADGTYRVVNEVTHVIATKPR